MRFEEIPGAPIEIPADLAKLPIQNVTASGGWGRTDYKIFVYCIAVGEILPLLRLHYSKYSLSLLQFFLKKI